MSDKYIKFKISTDKINLHFSGTDEFVSRNINEFKNEIELILKKIDKEKSSSSKEISPVENTPTQLSDPTNNPYPRVLNFEKDGTFQIIPRIVDKNFGKTTSDKIKNIALIFLWASHRTGIESVESKTFRNYCSDKDKRLIDSNFATIIANTDYIISFGRKNSPIKSLKLSDPGIEAAEQLLSKLNEAGNS
jgi:hypothetical protein